MRRLRGWIRLLGRGRGRFALLGALGLVLAGCTKLHYVDASGRTVDYSYTVFQEKHAKVVLVDGTVIQFDGTSDPMVKAMETIDGLVAKAETMAATGGTP